MDFENPAYEDDYDEDILGDEDDAGNYEDDNFNDFYEQDNPENIEMQDLDGYEYRDGFLVIPEKETAFVDNLPEIPDTPLTLEKAEKIKSFYKYLEDSGYRVNKNAQLEHGAIFKFNTDKELAITFKDKTIRLTHAKNPNEFLKPKTLSSMYGRGGVHFVRDVLGIINFDKPDLSPETRQTLNELKESTEKTSSATTSQENIEMQTIQTVEEKIEKVLETTSAQTELALGPEGSLPFRELAGLDRSLRNMRTNVQHLISERESRKARVRELKLETDKVAYDDDGEVQFSENLQEKQREINTLKEEIKLFDAEIREYDGKFRSQFQRIKQTINKMLNEDMTLGEQIQTLFREQGITIVSIITALGLTISMIVEAILSAAKSAIKPTPTPTPSPTPKPKPKPKPTPDPPEPEPGIKGWVKQQLRNIANLLLKLADKMLVALPGIIGTIVNFILKAASNAVGFIAQNVWILIVAVVGILYNYVDSLS